MEERIKNGADTDGQLQREYNGEHIKMVCSVNIYEGSTLSEALKEIAQLSHRFYLDAAEEFKDRL